MPVCFFNLKNGPSFTFLCVFSVVLFSLWPFLFVFLRDWERVDKQKNIVVEVLPVGGTVADRSLKAAL